MKMIVNSKEISITACQGGSVNVAVRDTSTDPARTTNIVFNSVEAAGFIAGFKAASNA